MRIFIEPRDVLLFRDGTPFGELGEHHEVRSMFPPLPSVFYGALRAAMIQHSSLNWDQYYAGDFTAEPDLETRVGTIHKAGEMTITDLTLARKEGRRVRRVVYAPLDLVAEKGGDQIFHYLKPVDHLSSDIGGNLPNDQLRWVAPDGEFDYNYVVTNCRGYLEGESLMKYLLGEPVDALIDDTRITSREQRVGIGRNASKVTDEGRLFSAEFIRLYESYGFYLDVAQPADLPEKGWLRLGGDNRVGNYAAVDPPAMPVAAVRDRINSTSRLRAIVQTPALFDQGWRPDFIDPQTLEGDWDGLRLKLLSAIVGQPTTVSGWDIAAGQAKPLKRAVPAGSVYFFAIQEPVEEAWLGSLTKSLNANNRDGFGLSLIGGIHV